MPTITDQLIPLEKKIEECLPNATKAQLIAASMCAGRVVLALEQMDPGRNRPAIRETELYLTMTLEQRAGMDEKHSAEVLECVREIANSRRKIDVENQR